MTSARTTKGGTRWRRAGLLFLPAMLGVFILAGMTLFGVLPINLSVNGQQLKLTSNNGQATAPQGVDAYADVQQMKNNGPVDPALRATIPELRVPDGICLSLVLTFPFVGTNTIHIETTGETVAKDVTASAASFQAGQTELATDRDHAVLVAADAGMYGGRPGLFGLGVPTNVAITNLQATATGARIAGTLNIGGLRIPKLGRGDGVENGECY